MVIAVVASDDEFLEKVTVADSVGGSQAGPGQVQLQRAEKSEAAIKIIYAYESIERVFLHVSLHWFVYGCYGLSAVYPDLFVGRERRVHGQRVTSL